MYVNSNNTINSSYNLIDINTNPDRKLLKNQGISVIKDLINEREYIQLKPQTEYDASNFFNEQLELFTNIRV